MYEQSNKMEKTKIAKEIILRIKAGGGRFLKQATKRSDADGSKRPAKRKNRECSTTIGWVEVTDVQVSQESIFPFFTIGFDPVLTGALLLGHLCLLLSVFQAREKIAHAFRNLRARAPKIPSAGHSNDAGASLAAGRGIFLGNNGNEMSAWDRCDCIGGAAGNMLPSSSFFYTQS